MKPSHYVTLPQAREILREMGLYLTERQMKRAAEPNAHGKRKLPFFLDPIDRRLKIDKDTLVGIYRQRQHEAEQQWRSE